jgi:hypothetical protein
MDGWKDGREQHSSMQQKGALELLKGRKDEEGEMVNEESE